MFLSYCHSPVPLSKPALCFKDHVIPSIAYPRLHEPDNIVHADCHNRRHQSHKQPVNPAALYPAINLLSHCTAPTWFLSPARPERYRNIIFPATPSTPNISRTGLISTPPPIPQTAPATDAPKLTAAKITYRTIFPLFHHQKQQNPVFCLTERIPSLCSNAFMREYKKLPAQQASPHNHLPYPISRFTELFPVVHPSKAAIHLNNSVSVPFCRI